MYIYVCVYTHIDIWTIYRYLNMYGHVCRCIYVFSTHECINTPIYIYIFTNIYTSKHICIYIQR